MNPSPDVLVVGLGPAGSRAAAAAAAAGYSVVALERRAVAGTPVQCAEFVPLMLDQELPGLGAVTAQTVARMVTYVEGEPADEMREFRGRMIDRAAFDRELAAAAARAGAQCLYGVGLLAIDADGAVLTTDRRRLRPKVLIGADGPRSRVAAAIGSDWGEMVETRQVLVPLLRPHDATDIFLRAAYPGGYGWLFPRGGTANLGLGVAAGQRHRLKDLLADLHAELAVAGRVGDKVLASTGGAIPVAGRRRAVGRLGRTAVLLAGDAAGLTNPITGAGIVSAVQSGALAGRAAAAWLGGAADGLANYEADLAETFDAALARAKARRAAVMRAHAARLAPAAALRASWIAYPEYWAA
jgi:digeranylgeranylglycerophospholipid reductase